MNSLMSSRMTTACESPSAILLQLFYCVETAASSSLLTRAVSAIQDIVDKQRPLLKSAEMANARSRMAAILERSSTPPSIDDLGGRARITGGRNVGRKGGKRLFERKERRHVGRAVTFFDMIATGLPRCLKTTDSVQWSKMDTVQATVTHF
jgi:hypothetical protein